MDSKWSACFSSYLRQLPCLVAYVWTLTQIVAVDPAPKPTLFSHEFSLADKVALVSGANRGIGLDMALALVEAGARAVYCVDVPKTPGEDWQKAKLYADNMQGKAGEGRLEYMQGDVANQVCR